MKKILSIIMAMCMIFTISAAAFAADANTSNSTLQIITPMSTSRPTSYAPTSWYNAWHSWGCSNYTYSSYIFDKDLGYNVDFEATKSFKVTFYKANGTTIGTYNAENYGSGVYSLSAVMDGLTTGYYFKITNTSGSTISGASYYIYE